MPIPAVAIIHAAHGRCAHEERDKTATNRLEGKQADRYVPARRHSQVGPTVRPQSGQALGRDRHRSTMSHPHRVGRARITSRRTTTRCSCFSWSTAYDLSGLPSLPMTLNMKAVLDPGPSGNVNVTTDPFATGSVSSRERCAGLRRSLSDATRAVSAKGVVAGQDSTRLTLCDEAGHAPIVRRPTRPRRCR